MNKFYEQLVKEVENSGELSPIGRKKICDKFESIYGKEAGKKKRQELELNALKKIQESWKIYTPISKELMKQVESILNAFWHKKQDEIKKMTKKFYKECDAEKVEDNSIYIEYLKQAIAYLEILLDDTLLEEEDECVPLKNVDLEEDEYDTSYCASMMWKYQDMEADRTTRKNREIQFWEWYIKEVARLLGDSITKDIKIESCIPDTPSLQITCAQDFVRAISSELDYIKYEKLDERKNLIIYVNKHKKGAICPQCGVFSNHFNMSVGTKSKLGKFKGWAIEFSNRLNFYYCDNKECPKEDFPEHTQIGLGEKKANFIYITKQKENEEIISKIFDL